MLITDDDILPRFLEHLSWATQVDLATAWGPRATKVSAPYGGSGRRLKSGPSWAFGAT